MPSRAAGVSASGGPLPRRGLFRYLVDFALAEYRNLHQNHVAGVINPLHSERIPEHKPTYRGGHNRSNQIPHKSAFFHGSIFNLFDMFVIRAGADPAGSPCGFIVRSEGTNSVANSGLADPLRIWHKAIFAPPGARKARRFGSFGSPSVRFRKYRCACRKDIDVMLKYCVSWRYSYLTLTIWR